MPIQPPSRAELARIAEAYHLGLSEEELATFAELAGPTLAGFGRLDELPDEALPVSYPREDVGHRPTGDENPSNGWSWKCSIRRRRGTARGTDGRRQGQRVRRGRPDAQRVADHGGLRPARGCDGGHAAARRRRAHRGQDGGPRLLLRRRRPDRLSRPATDQPSQPGVPVRLLLQRQRRRGGHRRGRPGARRRPGWLDPAAVLVERVLRAQAHARARALHRDLPDRAHARPHRPDGDDGGRLRADARGDRRRGRPRPAPDRGRDAVLHARDSRSARTGCGSACCGGLRDPGGLRGRRRRGGPGRRRRARAGTAPRSTRCRCRCTATGWRSGTRSRSRARPT